MGFGVPAAVAPTPANITFGDLKTRAARFVLLPDDEDADNVAGQAINDGILRLNARLWYWSLTHQDIWVVVGQQDYTLAANYKQSFHMLLLDSSYNTKGRLTYYNPKTFDRDFPDSSHTQGPCAFTVYSRDDTMLLSLDSKPPQNFQTQTPLMRHRYYRKLQRLVSDSDTLILPSEVEAYLLWHAKYVLAGQFDTGRKILDARTERDAVLRQLKRDDNESHWSNWS